MFYNIHQGLSDPLQFHESHENFNEGISVLFVPFVTYLKNTKTP